MRYVQYRPDSGKIVQTIECAPEYLGLQNFGTDEVIAHATATPATHYVQGGVVVAYSASGAARLAAGAPDGFRWEPATEQWVDERQAEQLRAQLWTAIKARRDVAEYGVFMWDGSSFNADRESRNRIMGATQLASMAAASGQPYQIVWTLADNTTRTLSAMEMMSVGATLGARVAAAHARAAELRAQVTAAPGMDALRAIDITAGWPA